MYPPESEFVSVKNILFTLLAKGSLVDQNFPTSCHQTFPKLFDVALKSQKKKTAVYVLLCIMTIYVNYLAISSTQVNIN